MNPNKIKWHLGSSSLSIIMEQDRRHWLLKTDKTKFTQDAISGDKFKGQIDNLGSDIVVETSKEPFLDYVVQKGTFSDENVSDLLELTDSVFPYVPKLNGLHFARLKSINLDSGGGTDQPGHNGEHAYHNFQLILKDTTVICVPMAPDPEDGSVLTYRWVRTTTNPILHADDGVGNVFEQTVRFGNGVSNPVFYYPLESSIMPFELTTTIPTPSMNVSMISTITIVDEESIGKPLFWFTCDESNNGPVCNIANGGTRSRAPEYNILEPGHEGNQSNYKEHLYPATSIESCAAPDEYMENWVILATYNGTFANTVGDFDVNLTEIRFFKDQGENSLTRVLSFDGSNGNNVIKMSNNGLWEYVDEHTYRVAVSAFSENLYENHQPLIPAFDVDLDQSISFYNTTTDVGFAGIRMGSSQNLSEQLPRYPHDITNLEGLPDWLNSENATPQHMSLYALHNTPYYDPNDQSTRQIAGLILDPGIERTYNSKYYPGQYRILRVDIVKRGTGYNRHTVTNVQRVYALFDDGTRSNTFFEITEVDENGGVLAVNPLYLDENDNVAQTFRGFYDPDSNAFYYNPQFTGDPIPVFNNTYYVNLPEPRVYRAHVDDPRYSISPYFEPESYTDISDLTGFELTYDTEQITGDYLRTAWRTNTYSEEEIREVMDHYYSIPVEEREDEDAHMPNGLPFWVFTTASGEGLVLRIRDIVAYVPNEPRSGDYLQEVAPPITTDNIPADQLGRVYVLSNDSPTYVNNARALNPKPDRTLARICDIPTSVMQLTNIHGLAPTSVVDKKYIRSTASFTSEDLEYIYNGSKNRWVRPIHLDSQKNPITDREEQTNNFIFDSFDLLNAVSMSSINGFTITIRLNGMVDPDHVKVYAISEPGTGYHVNDEGIIVVGGFSFTYVVDEVDDFGSVISVSIGSNDSQGTLINLANFDLLGNTGRTQPYGTSPSGNNSGTGLKISLVIDNYQTLIPRDGNVFSDLYAFARDAHGIWLMTYDTTNKKWTKVEQIAQTNYSDTKKEDGSVSLKDSYINSIIPSIRSFTVHPFDDKEADVSLDAFQTPSSINVIDDNRTPVHIPSASDTSKLIDNRTVIDINRFYCNQIKSVEATSRNETAVIQKIKQIGDARFDSFIFWQWNDLQDPMNCMFTYGVIHRSLDNIQTTDSTSTLPDNDLICDNFVNTNAQTTIMWNVPHVGPMVWMFNPKSNIHEKYYVDADTRELYVTREEFSWDKVEIMYSDGDQTRTITLVDETGKMKYNIITNNSALVNPPESSVIYQQPDYQHILTSNSNEKDQQTKVKPTGSWELVFPANTHSFRLRGMDQSVEYTPVKMNVIRGADIIDNTDVLNSEGIPVNYKTLLIDENSQTGRLRTRIYNRETGEWVNT